MKKHIANIITGSRIAFSLPLLFIPRSGFVRRKKLVALHTVLNKTTGFVLFILPLTFTFVKPTYTVLVICCLATIAAMQEAICVTKA